MAIRLVLSDQVTYVSWSDKTSLITIKYTHAYNGIYLLFCKCYSNSVSFIELLRIFASYVHGEVCAKIVFRKKVIKLKRLKITSNFYGNKTGFVRSGHILYMLQSLIISILCRYESPFKKVPFVYVHVS